MKKFHQKTIGGAAVAAICLLTITLSSCLKNNNNENLPQTTTAALAIVDAAPDAGSLDFFLDNTLVTGTPLTPGTYLTYFKAISGSRVPNFRNSGTTTIVASDTVNLATGKGYTLFLSNRVNGQADLFLVIDTLTQTTAGMASIRLVDVSPDAPAVDFAVKGSSSILVSNKTYRTASSFVPIAPATNDTLVVRQTGTNTILASIPATTLQSGAIYTVYLYGFAGATDSKKLALGGMVNGYIN